MESNDFVLPPRFYPLDEMNIGDSIIISDNKPRNVQTYVCRKNKTTNKVFITRTGIYGTRIIRVK
jgi:hypothetical protein